MPLFDDMPSELQGRLIEDAIQIGNVLKLFCDFTRPPKDKRLSLFSVDPLIAVFLINSTISTFIANRPSLNASQIHISHNDYSFISHDSVVSCHELLSAFTGEEVTRQLKMDYSRVLGKIDVELRDKIVSVVSTSMTLSSAEKNLVVENLNGLNFN